MALAPASACTWHHPRRPSAERFAAPRCSSWPAPSRRCEPRPSASSTTVIVQRRRETAVLTRPPTRGTGCARAVRRCAPPL